MKFPGFDPNGNAATNMAWVFKKDYLANSIDETQTNENSFFVYPNPANDTWLELTPHPGKSRWAPGSFVINDDIFFFGGVNRYTNTYPADLLSFDISAATVGMEEGLEESTYAYPNPASDLISWEYQPTVTKVVLVNMLGQHIVSSASGAKHMDVSNLSSGLYYVRFYAHNSLLKTSKVLVQH